MAHAATLNISNLSKQYQVRDKSLSVLEDISLSVKPGEFVSIVGSSGCGKSTLLKLIIGLEDDFQGELLLDEPFGALDAFTRIYLQEELQRIWEKEGITMILVTHDVEEAVYLGDRVVVMQPNPGRIKRIIDVPLARERNRTSTEFTATKEEVLREFAHESAPIRPAEESVPKEVAAQEPLLAHAA